MSEQVDMVVYAYPTFHRSIEDALCDLQRRG